MRKPIYYYFKKQFFAVLFIWLTKTKIKYGKKKIFHRQNAHIVDKMLKLYIFCRFLIIKYKLFILAFKLFNLFFSVVQRYFTIYFFVGPSTIFREFLDCKHPNTPRASMVITCFSLTYYCCLK